MKCKYRVRWFSSKGAFLVMLWTLLVSITCNLLPYFGNNVLADLSGPINWLVSIPITLILVSAPLSGWLADAKFGNYQVFRVGVVVLFICTVMNCLFMILEALAWENSSVLKWIHFCLVNSLFAVGTCACCVTALPLGLDQMPDASSSNVSSYIVWFVCSIFIGLFLSDVLHLLKHNGFNVFLIFSLFCTLCMSVVLILNFLFSPKWLIIEPKSPQSLKTIYRVLKFAVQHKAPLNRSAFTYWEKDLPSRIDLGKSKYGGPFTTEQVEDVKTTLRLLAISLPLFFIGVSLSFIPYSLAQHSLSTAARVLFTHSVSVHAIVATLVFEFIIYPLVKNKLPSILKKITAVPLILTFVSFVYLVYKLVHYLSHSIETTGELIIHHLLFAVSSVLFQVLLTSSLEFMCAQSPYNMRGLMVSILVLIAISSGIVGFNFGDFVQHNMCSQAWCSLIPSSAKMLTCCIGFLLFCVVARWYKLRVRDEDFSTQRVVEEVYDRYLTAAAAQTNRYGSIASK